jgi:hypothetical protein
MRDFTVSFYSPRSWKGETPYWSVDWFSSKYGGPSVLRVLGVQVIW